MTQGLLVDITRCCMSTENKNKVHYITCKYAIIIIFYIQCAYNMQGRVAKKSSTIHILLCDGLRDDM